MTIIESFDRVIEFVTQTTDIPVSIDLSIRCGDPLSFWTGISLDRGKITVNPRLADLGNFIHDLGHIATCPPALRQFATGKMGADFRREIEWLDRQNSNTSSRRFGADEDIDDDAATYWAVLLSIELGLPTGVVFDRGFGADADKLYQSCIEAYHHHAPSVFSTALYCRGLLESPTAREPIAWDLTRVKQSALSCRS
jgi:hypothetical protein